MSTGSDNIQTNGRPSANGKASVSHAQGERSDARAATPSRGRYEADAQALADVWDPRKRREREAAAAAAEAAEAAAAAEAERLAREQAVRAQRAKEAAAKEAAEKASREAREKEAAQASRRRLSALPEIDTKKPSVDPNSLPSIAPTSASAAEESGAQAVATAPRGNEPQGASASAGESELRQKLVVITAQRQAQASEGGDEAATSGDDFGQETPEGLDASGATGELDKVEQGEAIQEGGESPEEGAMPRPRPAGKPVRRKVSSGSGKAEAKPRKPVRKKRSVWGKVIAAVLLVIVVALAAVTVYASMTRWVLVDDAADIKGSWHLSGEPVSVTITDDEMDLAGKATYQYTINTQSKIISETLGNMQGTARYRFSEDRNSVALVDGGSDDWWGNAMIDLKWYADCLISKITGGKEPDLLGGDSGIIIYREGYDAPGVVTSMVVGSTSEVEGSETAAANASSPTTEAERAAGSEAAATAASASEAASDASTATVATAASSSGGASAATTQ